jgi:hypothetical protein
MTALHGVVEARHGRDELCVSDNGDRHLISGCDHRYPCFGCRGCQNRDDRLGQRTADVQRQRGKLASRRHQINRDALPLSRVRASPKLVPELVRDVIRLD